jgi:plasmid stability protein
MRDPVEDLIDALYDYSHGRRLEHEDRELLRSALKRWVKREVRDHALSGEEIA